MTTPEAKPPRNTILGRGSYRESLRVGEILRKETIGGLILIVAAAVAIIWANSPWGAGYFALRDFHLAVPLPGVDLDLSIGHWASDGLLAVFFFLTGLELKKEFVIGDLKDFSRAIVPVTAAFGGVLVPALIYVALNISAGGSTLHGWAIPTATDIAFAVAVLAVIGSSLPAPLRLFLLTLAVVDDLIAIVIIAFVYTDELKLEYLGLFLIPLLVFFFVAQRFQKLFATRRWAAWVVLLPLGLIAWALLHESGVHATIAGVLLGFAVPVLRRDRGDGSGLSERLEHRFRPLSTGFCVPVFAFFSAGVALGGAEGIGKALTDPVVWGIVIGLVLGKPIGIMGSTYLLTRTRHARLNPSIRWGDLFGVTLIAGIGFTVSLLVSELSFGLESPHYEHAKVAILVGSLLAAILGAIWLAPRNRYYRQLAEQERRDDDGDGVPDVYEQD